MKNGLIITTIFLLLTIVFFINCGSKDAGSSTGTSSSSPLPSPSVNCGGEECL